MSEVANQVSDFNRDWRGFCVNVGARRGSPENSLIGCNAHLGLPLLRRYRRAIEIPNRQGGGTTPFRRSDCYLT